MPEATQLRICPDGSIVGNDYRIADDGHLEMRTLDARVHACNYEWRRMTENEMAIHSAIRTIVTQWYEDKLTRLNVTEIQDFT